MAGMVTPPPAETPSFLRRFRVPIAIAAVVLLAVTAGPFIYINFIKAEPAERLSLDDVETTTTEGDGTEPAAEGIDGAWATTDQSRVQYRVPETLFGQSTEATGVADGITGTVEISGTTVSTVDVEVDMTTFESDESNRDGQFQGRIMETSVFPTATFTLTEPIDLGAVPADGEEITVEARGDLTMHGVTQSITFELTAKLTGDTFAVNATIPITFTDYGIDDPSGGPASVGTDGELELLLVFSR
jgi:polyisoprenoid-binding protein YceI